MCGIVGYAGSNYDAIDTILESLEKLEYRGYDSSGIAYISDENLYVEKKQGRISNLREHIKNIKKESNIGIGHTRWATHGLPIDKNAHPHYSEKKDVMLVHNGIIENYLELKNKLIAENVKFNSDTDSEVVAQLFSKIYDGNAMSTLNKVLEKIRGSYALAIMHKDEKNKIFFCKNHSPLIIGLGAKNNFIASDISAILKHTNKIIFVEDGDKGYISNNEVVIFDKNNNEVKREINEINWNFEQATKCGYEHFMIKEIEEQPEIIQKTLNVYADENKINFDDQLENINLEKINKIYIVACGTAYHAGLQAKYFFKKIVDMEISVDIASEFRFEEPNIDENTLAIFISQSGETYDTLMSLKFAKEMGAKTLAISNVLGSTITREADAVIYTLAGPEISVASTKAYTAQCLVLYLFAIYFAEIKNKISRENLKNYLQDVKELISGIQNLISQKEKIKNIIYKTENFHNGFYIGRGIDEKIAREGSLKMKEISYMHTEAIAAGELKHGTIALIEKNVMVVAICTNDDMDEKMIANIKEVKARGAYVISIGTEKSKMDQVSDENIKINSCGNFLTPLCAVVAMQYLSYYKALSLNLDIDKPRNLAKSVTVE